MSLKRSTSSDPYKSGNKKKFKKLTQKIIAPTCSITSTNEDEINELDLLKISPKNTQEAIDYLYSLFPSNQQINMPPIIYQHQLYNFNLNRTQVDRDINQLKQENKIKLFKFDAKSEQICICNSDSLVNYFKTLSKANQQPEYNDLVKLVIDRFYSKPSEMQINKTELQNKFKINDSGITKLIHNGFLTIKDAETYWLSIPNIGIFTKLIQDARRLLAFIIGKKKFKEMTLSELKQRNLKKLKLLGILYHCYDVIGSDIFSKVESPMGFVMRLNNDE
jgi:serine/threonine-protein kinase 19